VTKLPAPDVLDTYLRDMLRALDADAQHSALALALTIPDICGSIEFPKEPKVGRRYTDWCDTWGKMLAVSGADCYALRCAFLHSGSEEFSGAAALAALFDHSVHNRSSRGGVVCAGASSRSRRRQANRPDPRRDFLSGHGHFRRRVAQSARKRFARR